MKEKIEVKKIEIKIGDKMLSLTPDQAKDLKRILNEMFETTVVHEHHHDHYRYWWWNYPITPYQPTPYWTVSYSSQSGATSSTLSDIGTVTLCLNAT